MPDSIVASASPVTLRPAIPADVSNLFNLIIALADYERLLHEVTGSLEALEQHLFGKDSCIEAIVAEVGGQAVGFALFFINYSSLLTQPGIYLEDLFVLPQCRGLGIGKALLAYLARLVIERNYGQLEWSVLDWNTPAIGFYQRIGAHLIEDARVCRVTGGALPQLACLASLNAGSSLRPVTTADLTTVFTLIQANVAYDGGLSRFRGTVDALADHLLNQAYVEAVVVEQDSQPIGLALFHTTYSTFLTKPGLFVEDLFVQPEYRNQGVGKALLTYLAQQVINRDYGRLEWRVRVWNQTAIDFYQRVGAAILPDWRLCQLHREATAQLARVHK